VSTVQWQEHGERGTTLALRLLRFAALRLGRRFIRPVLYPVALYFTLTSRTTRRVSREFLARVLPRPPRFRDVLRHVFSFASISLDRVFLLTGSHPFRVEGHYGPGTLETSRTRGALLFVAHFGSFEVMRVGAVKTHALPLRIDSSKGGVELVLKVREALDAGAVVGLMVDRARGAEKTLAVDFLGGTARLPVSPWLLASALKVPVMTVFGVWRGGDHYEAHVEMLADRVDLPRADRDAALRVLMQDYADRLATRVRASPYNWTNFYDFWAP
jgi:predicted LPLAT superfamily acyltransferase